MKRMFHLVTMRLMMSLGFALACAVGPSSVHGAVGRPIRGDVGGVGGDGPPGQTRLDKVEQAYAKTKQYQAKTAVTIKRKQGRWLEVDDARIRLAFDRPSHKLKIESPDFELVRAGKTLRARAWKMPGQYLQTKVSGEAKYAKLAKQVPLVSRVPIVDGIFLLADNPVSVLSEGVVSDATPLGPARDDPRQRPRLRFAMRQGQMTLRLNPESWLIERATLRVDAAKSGPKPGDYIEMRFAITLVKHDQPIDPKAFDFDTKNAQAVASLGRRGRRGPGMVGGSSAAASGAGQLAGQTGASGGQGGGQGGGQSGGQRGGQGAANNAVARKAPKFTLKDLDGKKHRLADVHARVIVITFWASWAPPCQKVLPALERLQTWAQKSDRSVKLLTINVGQKARQVRAFVKKNKITLPVLLDDFTVAEKYDMVTVPHTVIIGGGKIRAMHSGPAKDYVTLFENAIKPLLAKAKTKSRQTPEAQSQDVQSSKDAQSSNGQGSKNQSEADRPETGQPQTHRPTQTQGKAGQTKANRPTPDHANHTDHTTTGPATDQAPDHSTPPPAP